MRVGFNFLFHIVVIINANPKMRFYVDYNNELSVSVEIDTKVELVNFHGQSPVTLSLWTFL